MQGPLAMTTSALTLDAPGARLVVRFDRLLWLYAIVPATVALVACDALVLGFAVRSWLPAHPDRLALYTLLFNFPHIVASHLSMLDGAYVRAYWRRALLGLLGLGAITLVCMRLGDVAVFLFAMCVTHFHIVGQQVGLTFAQLRTGGVWAGAWRWLSQATAGLVLLAVLEPFAWARGPMLLLATALFVPSTLVTAVLAWRAPDGRARAYLLSNQAMFLAMLGCAVGGYGALSIVMPRFVHDLSAFYVYVVHDTNHDREGHPNLLFRAASALRLPPAIVGPAVAVALAFVVERLLPELARLHVVYWLSGLHYFMESFVWKSGSPHRESVSFR